MPQPSIQPSMVRRLQTSSAALLSFIPQRKANLSFCRRTPVLGVMNSLETRLANSANEIALAQSLRYQIFYREMSAKGNPLTQITRRDKDSFDSICDHLLVFDRSMSQPSNVIATYRLLRQQIAENNNGFYSATEFDLQPIISKNPNLNFLELGRSCVLPAYRNKRTIELLWQGSWSYIAQHNIDVMIGCASFQGIDPEQLALPLSYLHHHARAPKPWRVRAVSGRGCSMNRVPKHDIDRRKALQALPPLIKAYMRLGAWVGDEAVVDEQFGTTDVFIVLPIANIKQRYVDYYNAKIAN